MLNRRFLWIVLLGTLAALSMAIIWDSRERGHSSPGANTVSLEKQDVETGNSTLSEPDLRRIDYVRSVLDTLRHDRARLPYYGELIRIYTEVEQYHDAAGYAETRAKATKEPDDWKEAADLYLEVVRQGRDEEAVITSAKKAESLYITALDIRPGDVDLKTDLAVVYMSLLKPDKSLALLERVLEDDPDHVRANFNIGVLLHQMGKNEESIAFFDRSLKLSRNSEWETVVQGYIDRHHNELFH